MDLHRHFRRTDAKHVPRTRTSPVGKDRRDDARRGRSLGGSDRVPPGHVRGQPRPVVPEDRDPPGDRDPGQDPGSSGDPGGDTDTGRDEGDDRRHPGKAKGHDKDRDKGEKKGPDAAEGKGRKKGLNNAGQLAQENRQHAKRMAKDQRLEELAKKTNNAKLTEKTKMIREKETARHAKALKRIKAKTDDAKKDNTEREAK